MAFKLPELNYEEGALAPHIGAQTVNLHHKKHFQAYVDNVNKMVDGNGYAGLKLEEIVRKAWQEKNQGLINNGGQFYNHSLYFSNLSPKGGEVTERVKKKLTEDFGSFDEFRTKFIEAGMTQFGSGWAWLVQNKDSGKLEVAKTLNGESPFMHGENVTSLVACDVWEHSYYLDYQNRRAAYLEAFVDHLIDWKGVESKLS